MFPDGIAKQGLVLTGNVCIGYQLSSLFRRHGWTMQVVHSDVAAFSAILQRNNVEVVVADIGTPDLGGLAVLAYCHQNLPSITTLGVMRSEDEHLKKLAHLAGGCRDFFYLEDDSLQIDTSRGMGAALHSQHEAQRISAM